jgi:transcriptional regulator with GAF, ATPase, and Fis domain
MAEDDPMLSRRDSEGPEFFFGANLAGLRAHLDRILAADQRLQGPLPPVLIQGETGSGKTSIARWLHRHGPRAQGEMLEINCSAIPETLAESELFGHERGAFTGALTTHLGLFEAAAGGTLLLDEITSLSLPLQAKVLTTIEDNRIRRVGGNKTIRADMRLIAATNREIELLVSQGLFRADLFHRLNLYRVVIPPLRERGEDIINLAKLFIRQICRKYRLPARNVSTQGQRRLLACHWPGNVRELAHEIERAIVFGTGAELEFDHLSSTTSSDASPGAELDWLNPAFRFPVEGFALHTAIDRLMRLALRQSQGNISAAARLMGVPHDFIRYRLGRKKRKPVGTGSQTRRSPDHGFGTGSKSAADSKR